MPKVARQVRYDACARALPAVPRIERAPAEQFILLEHERSGWLRRVQLLAFSDRHGYIWWPLCGQYQIQIRGKHEGRLMYGRTAAAWTIESEDFERLRRRSPFSLYQSHLHQLV